MFEEKIIFDPVCGMTINIRNNSDNNLITEHSETDYHFCSSFCKDIFESNPKYFINLSKKQYGHTDSENDD